MKFGGKGIAPEEKKLQDALLRIRYANVPVVAAMRGLALGGGCELAVHCARRVAHVESYVGLVEVGVGLIRHPLIAAGAFTGSTRGGAALQAEANARPRPIPFYGELGSVNPLIALPAALAAKGVVMVDCPVSGGVPRAKTGELAIMAGGDDAALDRAEPVLRAMGTSVHRCGGIGAGQAMKALNNLVSAGGFLIAVEALLMGQRFGLDAGLMVDVLNASTGMNNSTQKKMRQFVLSRRFDAGFGLDLMVKDLSIALEVGRETQTPAPFAALCREMWAGAAAMLGPGQDHTAMAQLSERLAGEILGGNK